MAKARGRRKKRGGAGGRKRGGLMMGMRGGFKNLAGQVVGSEKSTKNRWLGTLLTVALVVAAVALLLSR